MGRWIVCVLLLPMLIGCGAKASRTIVPMGQIITIYSSIDNSTITDTVRFGHMRSGEVAIKSLQIRNSLPRPTLITGYTRTCGCTTFEFDPKPIMPDSVAAASLSFDSRGLSGWQFKLIEVGVDNAAAPLKIFIEAEVE